MGDELTKESHDGSYLNGICLASFTFLNKEKPEISTRVLYFLQEYCSISWRHPYRLDMEIVGSVTRVSWLTFNNDIKNNQLIKWPKESNFSSSFSAVLHFACLLQRMQQPDWLMYSDAVDRFILYFNVNPQSYTRLVPHAINLSNLLDLSSFRTLLIFGSTADSCFWRLSGLCSSCSLTIPLTFRADSDHEDNNWWMPGKRVRQVSWGRIS